MRASLLDKSGQKISSGRRTDYLGLTATASGTAADATIRRIHVAMGLAMALRNAGVHSGTVTTATLIEVSETFILPKATHGIHLVPCTRQVQDKWDGMENMLMINTMGCFSGRNSERLRTVSRMPILQQVIALRMTSLQRRVTKRSEVEKKSATREDTR